MAINFVPNEKGPDAVYDTLKVFGAPVFAMPRTPERYAPPGPDMEVRHERTGGTHPLNPEGTWRALDVSEGAFRISPTARTLAGADNTRTTAPKAPSGVQENVYDRWLQDMARKLKGGR